MSDPTMTTGLPSLDRVLKGILPGDNIVWQVDTVEEYQDLVTPYCHAAIANGKKLVYFRFARHEPLLPADSGAEIHELDPEQGFENFIAAIHAVIEGCRHRRLLRLRLSIQTGIGLVLRPDARQLLHADLPLSLRPGDGRVLRPVPQLPHLARGRAHPGDHTALPGYLQAQRRALRAAGEGPAPLFPHHEHAPRLARRRVQDRHGQCSHLRDPDLGGVVGTRFRQRCRLLGGQLPAGPRAAPLGRVPARPARQGQGRLRQTRQDDHLPRHGHAAPDSALSDPAGHSRHPQAHDRHRAGRRQDGRHVAGSLDPPEDRRSVRGRAGRARFLLHRVRRVLQLPGAQRGLVGTPEAARSAGLPRGRRAGPPAHPHRASSRRTSSSASRRWSTTSASSRSSSAPAPCWRTTSATPSRASTRASSAPTKARANSACRTCWPPFARSTPAP